MHIVHLSSELAPVAKVGGLGDVVYSLSNELLKQGYKVDVILPKYDTFDFTKVKNLQVCYREVWSYEGHTKYNNTIWSCELDKIKVYLIEPHHPRYYFSRGTIYGAEDNIERFLYFTRAAMEFIFKSRMNPDCLHLHDWPTSIASTLLKDMYVHLGLKVRGTLLTIHNIEYQGRCSVAQLSSTGLDGIKYLRPDKYQDPRYGDCINLLKGGIEDADFITTVSNSYAKEVMTAEYGHGLEYFVKRNEKKFKGILNGIDLEYWNPKKDPYLYKNFPYEDIESIDHIEDIIRSKHENKKKLFQMFDLTESEGPLFGCVTRLVEQKGPTLIAQAVRRCLKLGGQFILLGSEYSEEIKTTFENIKNEFASTKRFALCLERDEALAHMIFAGSDVIVVPSIFEPCGLTQMIALRYGCLPLVRKTGGLADTVIDLDDELEMQNKQNGFVFLNPTTEELSNTLDRCLSTYTYQKEKWKAAMLNGLLSDFSWKRSIREYLDLYLQLQEKKLKAPESNKKESAA